MIVIASLLIVRYYNCLSEDLYCLFFDELFFLSISISPY
ncbi:hypothetical protein FM106_15020 [Brachybacterium faecium]|nr:hypothetical protein FM106_15020 [Brachybacterium faecium]